ESNSLYGVQIWAGSNNNLIFRNQFLNNGENAKYSCTNTWYNQDTLEGNYWDDYDGEDNNNDGLGDTPYNVPGGSNQDIYVLGFFEESTQPPTQNQPPVANAGGPYTGYVDQFVYFDASGSHDPDGTIVSYHWSFGDGTTSDGLQIPHKYSEPGTYTVVLTVTDNNGAQDVDTATVTVLTTSHNQPPVANAGGPYYGRVGDALFFTAYLSYDPDGYIVSYLWDFGDGGKVFGENVTHVYSNEGVYTVTLTVADSNGSVDVANTTASVLPLNAPDKLVADAGVSYTGFVGENIVFKASVNEVNITSYTWDFGDGTTVTTLESSINHSYEDAGVYDVKLTVTDVFGRTAYDNTTAVISDPWKKDELPGFEFILLVAAVAVGLLVLKRNNHGGMRW
ncbi:MAG TPA: PKD domain-containing protein, partial [Thermoplasmatales archaeon]|nr:PKD domain-containing protein [Thermoplasmatales archaeon]